jgi:4-amino-4-deoxy-L-arabinose transferase-like glycosyltransferase
MLELSILAAICAASYVLKIPYFNLPLDRDFGAHGYIAYSMLKRKQVLYRDLYESKTPGLKLIYMLILRWFGLSRKSFRQFFALYNILTTIAVYALGARLFSPAAGLAAALLYALYSSVPCLWWHFSNTESYYVLPATLSFLFLAYGATGLVTTTFICIMLSGLLGGTTFMFKQPSLISTAAPAVFYLLLYAPHAMVVDLGLYGAGFSLPIIAFYVNFIVIKKTPWKKLPFSLESLNILHKYLTTPLFKANRTTIESNRRRFRTIFYDIIFLVVFSTAGGIALVLSPPSPGLMIIGWVILSFLAAIISRTYLAYHFIPPIPPMCILAGMVITDVGKNLLSAGLLHGSVVAALALAAALVLLLMMIYHLVKDLRMPRELLGMFYSGEDHVYALCEEVGKYIKGVTTEQDYVYSWGHQPDIYLWSERKAAVYCIYPPITNPTTFTREQITDEFAQLLSNKPKYFVMTSDFGKFKEFEQLLVTNYVLEKKYEPYIYVFKAK